MLCGRLATLGTFGGRKMKKIFTLFFIMSFYTISVYAQSATNRETSTVFPENGKYEIITSSITMRDTYLLNKETGDTWQLVSTNYGYAWEKIYRNSNLRDKIPDGYKGNIYQITMSGIAAKGIYLTNTLTGATWTLYEDKNGELFWGAISFPE